MNRNIPKPRIAALSILLALAGCGGGPAPTRQADPDRARAALREVLDAWARGESHDAERAAFAFARKLTFEPDKIGDADIEALRPFYEPKQVLEIAFAVANFNAMNRWTGALRIPQEDHRDYLGATISEANQSRPSRVAPIDLASACAAPSKRPAVGSRAEAEQALEAARTRTSRLPLAAGPDTDPAWVRLLLNFPKAGGVRIGMHRAAETKGALSAKLRAQLAWIAARNDRAWYALGQAKAHLAALGCNDDAVYALDGPLDAFPPAERTAFALARKLTVDPALVEDADVEALHAHFPDGQIAEIIHQITESAFFDRVTEVANLPLGE